MFHAFLIKYGEIGIKGKNRYLFEDALVAQIRHALKPVEGEFRVTKEQGRILREAMQERDRIIAEARASAEAAAKKELDEVKKQIQQEKEEAIRDIRRQVAVLSVDIAEKVIRKNLDEEHEQMEMIDRMLDEMLAKKEN